MATFASVGFIAFEIKILHCRAKKWHAWKWHIFLNFLEILYVWIYTGRAEKWHIFGNLAGLKICHFLALQCTSAEYPLSRINFEKFRDFSFEEKFANLRVNQKNDNKGE